MAAYVKNEKDRKEAAIRYCQNVIDRLNCEIAECDYEERPFGELVYSPGCYSFEKSELMNERQKWDVMKLILTGEAPFTVIDL